MKKFVVFAMVLCFSAAAYAQNYLETRKADLSVHAGVHIPLGDVELDNGDKYGFNAGGLLGVEGQYFFTDNLGVGANLDYAFYETEYIPNLGNFDLTMLYIGPEVVLRYPQPTYDVFASMGVGYIRNSVTSDKTDDSEDDSTIGVLLQAGGRFYVNTNVNVGVKLRYLHNKQDLDDTTFDLSAISLLVSLGYSF